MSSCIWVHVSILDWNCIMDRGFEVYGRNSYTSLPFVRGRFGLRREGNE